MVKIEEHVDFQRLIEKRLRTFYRFVDLSVFNDGLFFELPCEIQNVIVRNYLFVLWIYL